MDLISSDDDTEGSEEFDIEDFPFEELEWFWPIGVILTKTFV